MLKQLGIHLYDCVRWLQLYVVRSTSTKKMVREIDSVI